jgi:beta-lactamase regulating signal transducer with metallopeptidase domain
MGPTIELLNELAAFWSGSLLRATWQGGLAIAAAWVLVRCRPGVPPRVACWVWRLADLKLIVALLWATPLLLPLLAPATRPDQLPKTIAAPDLPPVLAGGSEPIMDSANEPAATPVFHRLSPACVLLMLWLSGVAGAVLLAGREWLIVTRLRRSCLPIDCPDVRCATTELALVLGLRSDPELRAGPVVARPMLVGAFRPAILLPVEMLRDLQRTVAIRPVLAHELAHIRRRDLLWSGLAGLVRALFFFHPLVWLAHREVLLAREAACDALALRASGLRPSEYGRILLDIATGGPERPSRWAATLGVAGSAGSLKRRLMAMKTTQQPSSRRLLSWAFALLAIGAVGMIPWRLVPREALAQELPAIQPATDAIRDGKDELAASKSAEREAYLQVAEARLKVALAEQEVAEALVGQAKAQAEQAVASREYRRKQLLRLGQLAQRRAIEQRLVDEEQDRYVSTQAAAQSAEANVAVARGTLEGTRATAREAEAIRDVAWAELRIARGNDPEAEKDLKTARTRLREARLDHARSEHKAARAEIDRAEANLGKARATVKYRTKVFERLKQLRRDNKIEQRLVDEEDQALTEARNAERYAEAAVGLARAQLKAAEARVKVAEADVIKPGPITPHSGPRR